MIHPNIVLLAGGRGKRLWPLSQDHLPKQFITLPNFNLSSFQLALKRSLKITDKKNIVIITDIEYEELVYKQIEKINLNPKDIKKIFEKYPDNTGMAIYACCSFFQKHNNDEITYFFPTDHVIFELEQFFKNILLEIDYKKINIFAEEVSDICQNFGYLIPGRKISNNYYHAKEFVEKPSIEKIKLLRQNTKIYKNMGIYLSKPSIMHNEFHKLHEDLPLITFNNNVEKNYTNSRYKGEAIDKMISERSQLINFIKINFKWQDIGSIKSLYQQFGESMVFECSINEKNAISFNEQNQEFNLKLTEKGVKIIKK